MGSITIFVGDDHERRAQAYAGARAKLERSSPNLLALEFAPSSWSIEQFENGIGGTSFLYSGVVVLLRDLFSDPAASAYLEGRLGEPMPQCAHLFVLEDDLSADLQKKLEKRKHIAIEEFARVKKAKGRSSLPFDLGAALIKGERKNAWLLFASGEREGLSPEEMYWGVVWKVKDALSRAPKAGIPFERLAGISRDLVRIYHEGKSGGLDFDLAFERMLLSL